MDNQQLSSQYNIGWLAGIIDGEGCFQIAKQKRPNKTFYFRPQIVIGNTNVAIIENISKIAKELELPYYILTREKATHISTRPFHVLTVIGLKRCQKWIDIVHDKVVGKSEQAKIMKEFIEHRLQQPVNSRKGECNLTDKDYQLREAMLKSNLRYKGQLLNDYTPNENN